MSELVEKIDGQLAFADDAIDALIGTLSMYVHSLDIPSIKAGNFARGEIAIARRRIAALNATLVDENARLREALEFYAREYNWRSSTSYMCGHGAIHCNAMADKGAKARTALSHKETNRHESR